MSLDFMRNEIKEIFRELASQNQTQCDYCDCVKEGEHEFYCLINRLKRISKYMPTESDILETYKMRNSPEIKEALEEAIEEKEYTKGIK